MIGDPLYRTQQSGRTMLLRKVLGYASYEHERCRRCAAWEINVQEDADCFRARENAPDSRFRHRFTRHSHRLF